MFNYYIGSSEIVENGDIEIKTIIQIVRIKMLHFIWKWLKGGKFFFK